MASNCSHQEPWLLENGNLKSLTKETRHGHGRTAHNLSSSSLRKKSDLTLISKIPYGCLRQMLANLQEVVFGTKLFVLFPAVPLAILAGCYGFGRVSSCSLQSWFIYILYIYISKMLNYSIEGTLMIIESEFIKKYGFRDFYEWILGLFYSGDVAI